MNLDEIIDEAQMLIDESDAATCGAALSAIMLIQNLAKYIKDNESPFGKKVAD